MQEDATRSEATTNPAEPSVRARLRALVRLAEIDASARHLEEQLHGIPAELEERRAAVTALENLVGGQKTQMDEAVTLLAAQQEELKMRNDLLSRSRAKSAKARNMREAEAAERELDAIRRSIRDAEEERDRLQSMIDQTKEVLDGPLQELEAQNAALVEASEGSEEHLAEIAIEHKAAVTGREEHIKLVPKRIYRRYERIRMKLFPAVVETVDGVCMGCRMRIPPQLYNQIVAGADFYECRTCHRYLYHPDVAGE